MDFYADSKNIKLITFNVANQKLQARENLPDFENGGGDKFFPWGEFSVGNKVYKEIFHGGGEEKITKFTEM